MTVQTLINDIRSKVGDSKANKYTNSKIIEVINEGLEELGKRGKVKKKKLSIPILPYQRTITIPDETFVDLTRVRYQGKNLPIYTHSKMDASLGNWEEKVGSSLECIVYDLKENDKEFIVYPLLKETETTYEALNDANGTLLLDIPNLPADSVYGIITSIDVDDIIVPENIYDETELAGYEPITSVSDAFISLEITYYCIPDKLDTALEDLNFVIDLSAQYRNTIVFYVSGMLLLNDNRTENTNKGAIFLQKYESLIKKDIGRSANSNQSAVADEIPYRTGF